MLQVDEEHDDQYAYEAEYHHGLQSHLEAEGDVRKQEAGDRLHKQDAPRNWGLTITTPPPEPQVA